MLSKLSNKDTKNAKHGQKPTKTRYRSEQLPRTFCVRVALMMISVRIGVTLTSTPEYPSSASSLVSTSFNSA
uniref:Uncharacterized protein n=1 Tax=Rhizophora mucronata TaxID=61149 RepID=A0A2P2KSQ5_RHIMU